MRSKHKWISHTTGGRSPGGTVSQPITRVAGLKPTSSESRLGILIPP
jgi:hypothetical protein